MIELRYERRDDTYTLKLWEGAGLDIQRSGRVDKQPPWLVKILLVAKIGGHLRYVTVAPPDEIVWFTIDKSYNLIGFTSP
jgi:hypothetical protein